MAQLFRKSAIERLSSPEQLDKSIVITSSMSWLSLIGVALIIVCFVVWAFCGTIPSITEAKGVISGGIYTNSVYSEFGGKISDIYVAEGDRVKKDTVLCSVVDGNNNSHDVLADEDITVTKQLVKKGDTVTYQEELFGISPYSSDDTYATFFVEAQKLPGIETGMKVIVNMPGYSNQKYGHMEGVVAHIDAFAATKDSIRRVLGNNEDVISYLEAEKTPVAFVTCKLKKDKDSENGLFWSSDNGRNLHVNAGSLVDVKIITDESAPVTKLIPGLDE